MEQPRSRKTNTVQHLSYVHNRSEVGICVFELRRLVRGWGHSREGRQNTDGMRGRGIMEQEASNGLGMEQQDR